MAFATKYPRSVAALLVMASTSVLFWFGNGLNPWWPLLWFAPLPVLLFRLAQLLVGRGSHSTPLLAGR